MYKCDGFYFFLGFYFSFFFDIQPVEQHAFFGAMSTPPDIPAPNVSMTCKTFPFDHNRGIVQVNYL